MSSITDPTRGQHGQAIVVFTLAAVVLMGVASLAFDVGMVLLEKRDKQNAADAAALAGARFLPDTATAQTRAQRIAELHDYVHGQDGVSVEISFSGTSFINVTIGDQHSSLFAGALGHAAWDVRAHAVAANVKDGTLPAALIALAPGCPADAEPALEIRGNGTVASNGNIQVNSACTEGEGAFVVAGNGTLDLGNPGITCNVVGKYTWGGNATSDCHPANEGAPAIPDPIAIGLPPKPPLPDPIIRLSGTKPIPEGCPGSTTPATDESPLKCAFGGTYDPANNGTWRVFPGYYPGGLNLQGGDFYLEPGIYYMGGGGFRVVNATATSVDPGGLTLGGGVLIANTSHPSVAADQIILQGGSVDTKLYPLNYDPLNCTSSRSAWDRFLVYQDRAATPNMEIVGNSSDMQARGLIYVPSGRVIVRAHGGTITLDAIIAYSFSIEGADGSTISVLFDPCFLPRFTYAGLVK